MDTNNQIVLLGFALVPIENKKWWTWFLNFVSRAFDNEGDGINEEERNMFFISDGDKGLKAAIESEFPAAFHGMCVFHLSENVRLRFGANAASLTYRLARAKSEGAVRTIQTEWMAEVPKGAEGWAYLEATDFERWVRFMCPNPRFGHITSNIAESLNNVLRMIRGLPTLQMIDAIWCYIMETRYERKKGPQRGIYDNRPVELLEQRLALGARFKLYPSANGVYQVEDLQGRRFVVNLEEKECECGGQSEYQAACSHMICVVKNQNLDVDDFINGMYSTETYRRTYEEPLYPLSIESLVPDSNAATPEFRTQKRRPKSKQMQKGQWIARRRKCGKCKKMITHTAPTCTNSAQELADAAQEERDAAELEEYVNNSHVEWQLELEPENAERLAFYADPANREDSYITMIDSENSPRSSITDPFAPESEDDEVVVVGGEPAVASG